MALDGEEARASSGSDGRAARRRAVSRALRGAHGLLATQRESVSLLAGGAMRCGSGSGSGGDEERRERLRECVRLLRGGANGRPAAAAADAEAVSASGEDEVGCAPDAALRQLLLRECLALIKADARDDAARESEAEAEQEEDDVVDAAAALVGSLCGEATRGAATLEIALERPLGAPPLRLVLALPSFASADVGCRAWAAAKVFFQWAHGSGAALVQLQTLAARRAPLRVVELGCGAVPLCGIAAAALLGAQSLLLTDYSDACLQPALDNAHRGLDALGVAGIAIDARAFNWADQAAAPPADIVVGSALVYEQEQAEILPAAILRCLAAGAARGPNAVRAADASPCQVGPGAALLALHEEHVGFPRFFQRCQEVGLRVEHRAEPVRVSEAGSSLTLSTVAFSKVHVVLLRPASAR
jgi:hypothetical protein